VTVRLTNITAAAHRDGNRVELSWTNPAPQQAPGVRVVRRTGTHATGPDDGVVVAHAIGLTSASDIGLQGETVYYYTLFPFSGTPPVYSPDPHNQISAMPIAPYARPRRARACRPTKTRVSCGASSICPAASWTGSTA
jgi:hypothetical protein